MKRDLGTGDIAKLLGVAARTVAKWIDRGALSGYRFPTMRPNSTEGDRRVRRGDLIRFILDHGFPMPVELMPRLLMLSLDPHLEATLGRHLADWQIDRANDVFNAGWQMAEDTPVAVVLDLRVGRAEASEVAAHAEARDIPVFVLLSEDDSSPLNGESSGCRLTWPSDPVVLANRIRSACVGRKVASRAVASQEHQATESAA